MYANVLFFRSSESENEWENNPINLNLVESFTKYTESHSYVLKFFTARFIYEWKYIKKSNRDADYDWLISNFSCRAQNKGE
jgi:hypothetical protein